MIPSALVAALVCAASTPSTPQAELSGEAVEVQVTARGQPQKQLRLKRGGALTLKVSGPAELSLELRVEALSPKAVALQLERDGKPVPAPELNRAIDASVRSDRGHAVTRPTVVPAPVGPGAHTVTLRWPGDASGDALVVFYGVSVAPALALPELSLPPLVKSEPKAGRPEPGLTLPPPPLVAAKPAPRSAGPDAPPELAPLTTSPAPVADARTTTTITAVPVAPDPRSTFSSPRGERFSLDVRVGADRSSESFTGPIALGRVGAELDFRPRPPVPVWVDLSLGLSRQPYQARQLASDGRSLSRTELDERRFDGLAATGWDLGPWLRGDGRLVALPYLGVQYTALRNGGFPEDLLGVAAGAKLRWALSPAFALQGGARWAYNLLKGTSLSAVGTPVSDLLIEAGLSLPLAGGYAVDLGYRGDVLALSYDTRVAHGMALGIHAAL